MRLVQFSSVAVMRTALDAYLNIVLYSIRDYDIWTPQAAKQH